MSWQDVRELVYDAVGSYFKYGGYDLYHPNEMEDHLLEYAARLNEDELNLHQIQKLLLNEADQFDTEQWCRLIEEEHNDTD